jgi:hypothetical protein
MRLVLVSMFATCRQTTFSFREDGVINAAIKEVLEGRQRYAVVHGKVADVLAGLPEGCASACLCDPPYGLGSREPTAKELIEYLRRAGEIDTGGDFMGWSWKVPTVREWEIVLRTLRPGAYTMSFGGPRMFDLIALGIRAAGFEMCDVLSWNFSEGMPKPATTTDKFIDKHLGMEREVIGKQTLTGNAGVSTKEKGGTYGVGVGVTKPKTIDITAPASEPAKQWAGYGQALRPGWEPILLACKPFDGNIAKTILAHDCGGLNITGCRIGLSGGTRKVDPEKYKTSGNSLSGSVDGSLNGGTKQAIKAGRWPCDVVLTHDERCVPVGTRDVKAATSVKHNGVANNGALEGMHGLGTYPPGTADAGYGVDGFETVETWACVPECPIRLLDDASGQHPSTLAGRGDPSASHENAGDNHGASTFGGGNSRVYADTGGVSRYYFSGKVASNEREYGCEHLPIRSAADCTKRSKKATRGPQAGAGRMDGYRNFHPTLKPIGLTRWLANLIRPPSKEALLVVPWAGSGSEMIGALLAGWPRVIGIEMNAEFVEIANCRIRAWLHRGDRQDVQNVDRERLVGQKSLFGG